MKKLTGKFTFYDILSICLILACFIAGLILMQYMPPQVPTHWNLEGKVDGISPSYVVLFCMPLFYLGIYLIISLLPLVDPKHNYEKFINPYSIMKLVIMGFLTVIHGLILCAAISVNLSMQIIVPSLVGVLFITLGLISPKIKQNYFVGFRTPWAIENPTVWEKTQKIGGICFIVCGILMIGFSLLQIYYITLGIIIPAVLIPFVYSYVIYKKGG